MGARLETTRELCRAGLDLALGPFRVTAYAARRRALTAAVARDLDAPAAVEDPGELDAAARERLLARPLRVFVSCAEPSGEIHALGLVAALRAELDALGAPPPELFGLGGTRLAAAGVDCIGDPVQRAAMGADVLRALPFYLGLVTATARTLVERAPDVVVPVDSPALHVPLGRIARRAGRPVVHFVTPQYWAWAPWRVGGYRAAVDRALTILPFEPAWFARHAVPTAHVGHPLLDALAEVPASRPEVEATPGRAPRLALLPGSRESVVRRNLPWMLTTLSRLRERIPELEVVLAHDRKELVEDLRASVAEAGAADWVHLADGGLHDALTRCDAAFSVSGTILLDLLHHRLPTVVVYRLKRRWMAALQDRALTVPYFASTNLLAGEELCPEFAFAGDGPVESIVAALERLLIDPAHRAATLAGLDRVAERLGPPGATRRAARHALGLAAAGIRP